MAATGLRTFGQIARLAADGLTNRGIGEQLHLSQRTVIPVV
ncbi:LuxR C-terminal-related transcriptional regulator [Kribbella sp. VKM Ac-2568]